MEKLSLLESIDCRAFILTGPWGSAGLDRENESFVSAKGSSARGDLLRAFKVVIAAQTGSSPVWVVSEVGAIHIFGRGDGP